MHPAFKDPTKKYAITLFIEDEDFRTHQAEFEMLGNQKNVKLIIQPCPFEAVEFLYRVDFEEKEFIHSFEKSFFWQAIALKGDTKDDKVEEIAQAHHAYLVAIVENDPKKVKVCKNNLKALL